MYLKSRVMHLLVKATLEDKDLSITLPKLIIVPNQVDNTYFPDGEVNTTLLWQELARMKELEDWKRYDGFCQVLINIIEDYQQGILP